MKHDIPFGTLNFDTKTLERKKKGKEPIKDYKVYKSDKEGDLKRKSIQLFL